MDNYIIWLYDTEGFLSIYYRLPTEEELDEETPTIKYFNHGDDDE